MQSFLRLALLGAFAAAGIGLAVFVAANTTPGEHGKGIDAAREIVRKLLPNALPMPQSAPVDNAAPVRHSLPVNAAPAKQIAATRTITDQSSSSSHLSNADLRTAHSQTTPPANTDVVHDDGATPPGPPLASAASHFSNSPTSPPSPQLAESPDAEQLQLHDVLYQSSPPAPRSVRRPATRTLPALHQADVNPFQNEPETAPGQAESLPAPTPRAARIYTEEGDDRLTINARNTDIREVLELLSEQAGLNILASKSVHGTVSASLNNVDIQTALDAILKSTGFVARREGQFIYVGTPEDLLQMDFLRDRVITRIYRTNYVTAAELQSLITPLLTQGIGSATVGSGKIAVSSPAEKGIQADTAQTGGDNFAGNEVILVRDYESVLMHIDQVVEEVDQCPRQVSIEAMILSVSLKDTVKLGVNFQVLRDKHNVRLVSSSPLTSLANIDVSSGGLNVGFLDGSLAAFVDALETIGDTNVIAAPRLLCLNRQRAEILIGDQKGYLTTTQTETAATQSVEFLDVGTQLRIRPYISSDGMIRMEVHPELSTGDVQLVGTFALPNKSVTQVTTNIMCPDGGTVVIGGLIREDLGKSASQIPVVGNIPILGAAFRRKTETNNRNEIIVLITPRIVRQSLACDEGEHYAGEFTQRQAIFADKMSPVGKRHYGRRYLGLARSAWQHGDVATARRNIDLALHFDPLNIEIINLRNEIMVASGECSSPSCAPAAGMLKPHDPGTNPTRLRWPAPPANVSPP